MRHRCLCGELVSLEGHRCKCSNEECIARGACGHHGPNGKCLAEYTDSDLLGIIEDSVTRLGKTVTPEQVKDAIMKQLAFFRERGWLAEFVDLENIHAYFTDDTKRRISLVVLR